MKVAGADIAEVIEASKDVLHARYEDLMRIFAFYSAMGSGNAFAMQVPYILGILHLWGTQSIQFYMPTKQPYVNLPSLPLTTSI